MANDDPQTLSFMVRRQDLRRYRFAEGSLSTAALRSSQILLAVDKFAFTANNITYALVGERMAYWSFFPADAEWGRIPVWGFADVVNSNHAQISEGERIYGFFPMSTHLIVDAERVERDSFFDGAAHRRSLHPAYNRYLRLERSQLDASREDLQALLRPLSTTAFLIDDYLADSDFFGAQAVILSSASSKTAAGAAFFLHRNKSRRAPYEVIGLTSPSHAGHVEGLGIYDRVLTYDAIRSLPEDLAVVFVDVAGNGQLRSALHHHFGDNMKHSSQVGAAHWDQAAADRDLPGAEPTPFFAPAQLQKRSQEWGSGVFHRRLEAAWEAFLETAAGWIEVRRGRGRAAVEATYLETLQGHAEPATGHLLSLWG